MVKKPHEFRNRNKLRIKSQSIEMKFFGTVLCGDDGSGYLRERSRKELLALIIAKTFRASHRDSLMLRGHLIAQGDCGAEAEC